MKKIKYFYNTNTLRYEKLIVPLRIKLLRILGFASAAIVTSAIIVSVANRFIEPQQVRKNRAVLNTLTNKYGELNDRVYKLQSQLHELEKRDNDVYRSIFEASPLPDSIRAKETEKLKAEKLVQSMSDNELTESIALSINNINSRMQFQDKSYDEIEKLIKNKEKLLASIPAIMPVSNKDLTRIASGFGTRIDPVYKTVKFHFGLDFTAPQGTPIYATADGVIEEAQYSATGYGNNIWINHGYGYRSHYGHMVRLKASERQKVKRGEVIGWVGSTGKSTGPHCHYEVEKNGVKVDPIYYFYSDLNAQQYEQIVKLAAASNQSFD